MTQTKKLKKAVRSRSRKTGESYTAARRQVLRKKAAARTAVRPVEKTTAPVEVSAKVAVSEKRIEEMTGHGYQHWFQVLDAFGAVQKGHTAAAAHLDSLGVPGWHAQGIVVAYERVRGVRAVNQRTDGTYEVSVSRVITATPSEVARAFNDKKRRGQWLADASPRLVRAIENAFEKDGKSMSVVKEGRQARVRYQAVGSKMEIVVDAQGESKSRVVAVSSRLPKAEDVTNQRAAWSGALDGLRQHLAG